MAGKWLNLFLRFSSFIFALKQKIVETKSWISSVPSLFLFLLSEFLFLIISLPFYLIVSPKKIQERGFIFPIKEKEFPAHLQVYVVRRKISVTTLLSVAGIFLLKFIFVGAVSSYLFGVQTLLAATQDWNFGTPGEYTYDDTAIEVTDGVAALAPIITSTSSTTINPGFTSNSNGWTYADWDQGTGEANINGGRTSSGGNPGAYINITAPTGKDDELGGYWRQGFTTTVANPTTTVNFDWKVAQYDSSPNPLTFKLYVFVDTGTGVPVIGQEVWSSGEITGTSGWTSVSNLDVSSKVTSAGTYYLKVAMWIETPGTNTGPFTVNFDNVLLQWSKNIVSYSATHPTIAPTASLTPAGVTSWNSFSETATKNGGEIYYQLSPDDGVTWYYWNGSVWATATLPTNYTTASVLNTYISSFSATAGKILWKAFLSGDGNQQVILDTVGVGYTQNAVPIVQSISASQDPSSGYVTVVYSLQDTDSDPNNLVDYEYSLTGAFAGEQETMTVASGDPAHDGITSLSSSPSGVTHTFVWNAALDLGTIYSSTVFVRLRSTDGIANSAYLVSLPLSVDYAEPIVSNVTATQLSDTTDVQIEYQLSDDTLNDNVVELQISDDGGSTWNVPVISVSGDVGSGITSGINKSILWQAGIDYTDQEKNTMMVRVRAVDTYHNQGDYTNSVNFVLDTRAPVIVTQANILAQPRAGETTVLVGGGFSENNPNTNNFYVALNDDGYGSPEPGDTNTATPSDKNVPVGVILKGNDYISSVKIQHLDDFGHLTVNENASPDPVYRYVKPYTPPAPTIGNPGVDSLEVTINKHSSEVDGLEYAIFENTQNLYVQSDGSLGVDPYWQSAGTNIVTGLSQPISLYSFKVKSRNVRDINHAVSSESDFSNSASSDYQSPLLVINSVAQTIDGTQYVLINYTGTDFENRLNQLVTYEYSLNGIDWQNMTEKIGVGSMGVTNLPFTNSGAAFVFAWDVGTDLSGIEDSSVYIRLESNDSITNSNRAVSSVFAVDTAAPVISNISVTQILETDTVSILYDLADDSGFDSVVTLALSDDSGATYMVSSSSVTGDVGDTITTGLSREIVWNAGIDFSDQEKSTMRAKIVATDRYGNEAYPVESADFSLDTQDPVISAVSAVQSSGSGLVAVTYHLSDQSSSTVQFDISSDSGATWNIATTTYTGDVGISQVAGLRSFYWNAGVDFPDEEMGTMRVRVRAIDNFGHYGAYEESSDFSVNTYVLSISHITVEQNLGMKIVTIHYDLNKNATTSLDISSDGGVTWNVATTTLAGHIGSGITAGNTKTITWEPDIDFNNEEISTMRVRLRGVDIFGTVSSYYESSDFSVDTASPLGLLSLHLFGQTDNSVTMNWSSGVTDAHFNHYELWHGNIRDDVINRTGTAHQWSITEDPHLNSLSTISTAITGISLLSDYYIKIWAIDDYGNEIAFTDLNVFSTLTSSSVEESAQPSSEAIFIPDITPPDKPILSSVVSPTNISTVKISGLAEPGSEIDLYDAGVFVERLNTRSDVYGQFSQSINFSEGEHLFTVRAIDDSSNISEASDPVNVKIKVTPPDPPILLSPKNGEEITESTPLLVGVAEPLSKVFITLDGINTFDVTVDDKGAWQFKIPTDFILKDGDHTFVLIATDQAENTSAATTVNVKKTTASLLENIIPIGSNSISVPEETTQLIRENVNATEDKGVPIPIVSGVKIAAARDGFMFTGTALPRQDIIVYVHSDQALIYHTTADKDGIWTINHSQDQVELAPGEHTIYAVAVDKSAQIKSQPSLVSTFTVSKNFWVSLFERLNLQTTIITLITVLLTLVWLYWIKKKDLARLKV